VVAAFPVYRTYIVDRPSAQDRRFIDWAIGRARRRSLGRRRQRVRLPAPRAARPPLPGAPAGLASATAPSRGAAAVHRAGGWPRASRTPRCTAPPLISLNDVGGDPEVFGLSVAAFHAASRERALRWPHGMLATSTHDAKRSEDVRARIDVISEMPAAWRLAVRRWSRMNRRHKRTVDGRPAPTRNDEYLLYQMLVGSLPPGRWTTARWPPTRAHRAGDAEVGARIQGGHELDEPEPGLRGGAGRLRARAARPARGQLCSWPT
jgi:(1->4)-alpha-D-glucan 1-alpha-D-glucosylmutase